MKLRIISLLLVIAGVFSCAPDPSACMGHTWTYEVLLSDPVPTGSFIITYNDGYGNQAPGDTTMTQTWTKDVTPFSELYSHTWQVIISPTAKWIIAGIPNFIKVRIYKDGDIVQSTGDPVPVSTEMSVTLLDTCN
jgi:hypothetical protein